MKSKFLLLLGVTGCGKSSLIRILEVLDRRFIYIKPYTTRTLRENETDKVSISENEMQRLWDTGSLLTITNLYGVKYGTPHNLITESLKTNNFPILDFPIQKIQVMERLFHDKLVKVYIYPPSIEELSKRLKGRSDFTHRFKFAKDELTDFKKGLFHTKIDLFIANETNKEKETANLIYKYYLDKL
jgi:guanylate kinase